MDPWNLLTFEQLHQLCHEFANWVGRTNQNVPEVLGKAQELLACVP